MFERIWVTPEDFTVDSVDDIHADIVILRQPWLSESDYVTLAKTLHAKIGDKLIIHTHADIATELGVSLHLPYQLLGSATRDFGVSIHSANELQRAINAGAKYVLAGHVFDTLSHPGTQGRGINWLETILEETTIPVYAIGGINSTNIDNIQKLQEFYPMLAGLAQMRGA